MNEEEVFDGEFAYNSMHRERPGEPEPSFLRSGYAGKDLGTTLGCG